MDRSPIVVDLLRYESAVDDSAALHTRKDYFFEANVGVGVASNFRTYQSSELIHSKSNLVEKLRVRNYPNTHARPTNDWDG